MAGALCAGTGSTVAPPRGSCAGATRTSCLQDHSLRTVDKPEEFHESVGRWKQVIERVGARTVLFATWPRHPEARLYREHPLVHSFEEMAAQVDGAYETAAQQLSADLAPVGRAFERAVAEQPDLEVYRSDATHPTLGGSFLAACVLYGAITGGDPRASAYVPWELGPEPAALVKTLAAETLGRTPLPVDVAGVPDAPGVMATNKPP